MVTHSRPTRLVGSLILAMLVWLAAAAPALAHLDHEDTADDYVVPGGWYYTQTGGGTGRGYAITDYDGIGFWQGGKNGQRTQP